VAIGDFYSATVPAGATQLLMGINDGGQWSDNSGAVVMSITLTTKNAQSVTVNTHPFTDVTDASGNATGTIVAQGNGVQAGSPGPLYAFQAVFTGTFTVPEAADVPIDIFANAGFVLGVGDGATSVSGPSTNSPASGVTVFNSLPVMGAYNATQEANNVVVVHFPQAGTYHYEVDYACSGAAGGPVTPSANDLSLVMRYGQTTSAGTTIINVVPPTAGSLVLNPLASPELDTGQVQTLTVIAQDAFGNPVANLPVAVVISGANQPQTTGAPAVVTTGATGTANYSYVGTNAGTDLFQAVAVISGSRVTSNTITVPWISAPVNGGSVTTQSNLPPVVNAGPDQQIMLTSSATLNGSVTDDGLPAGAPLTTYWSQVSGPTVTPQNGYEFGQVIKIDHTKVPNTDQTDFPLLISGKYTYLATAAYEGDVINPNGWDIIFTSDAAGLVKLDHEIDTYDPTTGTVNFWVRIPALSHTEDTTIYMWYGNGAITTTQENKVGVWKNGYLSVYHFSTTDVTNDSGPSAYNLSVAGSGTTGFGSVPAKIGAGYSFNGNDADYLFHEAVTGYPRGSASATLEAWASTSSSANNGVVAYGANSFNGSRIALYWGETGDGLDFENMGAGEVVSNDSRWHHLVASYSGGAITSSSVTLFVDGVQHSTQGSGKPDVTTDELKIGGTPTVTFCCAYAGLVDEVRISGVTRSADWVATEYNNQSSPATFYRMGDGTVAFSDSSSAVTSATFSIPGTYVLQLSANDTQYTSWSQTTVQVYPAQAANQPPVVSAGPSQTVTLPSQATLAGTVTDDGLPVGAIVTSQWSLLSGPASVVFGNASQPVTTATFSQTGVYVLRLSANDTQYTTTATVTVVVNAAVTSANQPPVVSANPLLPAVEGVSLAYPMAR
jgi:hypothetical protein